MVFKTLYVLVLKTKVASGIGSVTVITFFLDVCMIRSGRTMRTKGLKGLA